MERTQPHETEANFSIEEYGAKTAETEECEEELLAESRRPDQLSSIDWRVLAGVVPDWQPG